MEKVIVQIQEKPEHHLIDMFWDKFRVETDINALLRNVPRDQDTHVLDVDVTRLADARRMTIRFVQGSRSADFSEFGGEARIFDLLLVLDKHYKSLELFQKGIKGSLSSLKMRAHGLIPFLVNTTVQSALITQAWTDTDLIQNKIFAFNYNARIYADYMSVANALFHILENAWRETPYTVVLVCRVGTERSLLVLAMFMLMFHGNRLMSELRPEATLIERVNYMRSRLEELDLSALASRATDTFQTHLKLVGHKLANLPVYDEPEVGVTKQGVKRALQQCFYCSTPIVGERVYHCPYTRMIACDYACLVMGHAQVLEESGVKEMFY